jgi:HEAT repeat protein
VGQVLAASGFRLLLASIWICLSLVLGVLTFLVIYKAARALLNRYWSFRRAAYTEALERLISEQPAFSSLRPRLWGDADVIEELLIETFASVTGSLKESVSRAAVENGLVARRIRQLRRRGMHTRAFAAERLGLLGSGLAAGALAAALPRERYGVQIVIIRALGRIHSPEGLPVLLAVLGTDKGLLSTSITQALLSYGEVALPALLSLAENPGPGRAEAIGILGQMHALQSLSTLIAALSSEKDASVRIAAARALGFLAHPDALPALRTALNDTFREVRVQAAWALGRIGDPAVCAELEAAMRDRYWWVRVRAAEALAHLGPPGVERLRRMATEPDPQRRQLASEMLATAGGQR